MPDNFFDRAKPKLNPPVSAWKEDLPENNQPQLVPPQLLWLNKINDTWLEIPRYDKGMTWWGMIPSAVLMLGFTIYSLYSIVIMKISWHLSGNILLLVVLLSFMFFLHCFLFCMKLYFVTPRDQPVRFNKKRQNVYVFKCKKDRIPWFKWPVIITDITGLMFTVKSGIAAIATVRAISYGARSANRERIMSSIVFSLQTESPQSYSKSGVSSVCI